MKKIRVLIVEDSKVIREFLEHIIGQDPRLEIAGAVGSAEVALSILDRVSPDVISMDINLPGMNGFEATERVMSQRPTPIVVVSAGTECEHLNIAMNALQAGALTVLEKPVGVSSADYAKLAGRLCTQLAIMSQVKVVRRRSGPARIQRQAHLTGRPDAYQVLGIVSSTGGPNALVGLLGGLGKDFPLPIILVQHITDNFLEGFASWLGSVCPFPFVIVRDRAVIVPGTIFLAPPGHHLRTEHGYLQTDKGDPICSQRPSGNALFESMAVTFGVRAIGVILTGMGEDGAAGLLQIRKKGGHTIAEDESTAIVYGMPAEAVRLGAVCESLPLPEIAPRILDLALPKKRVAS